MPICQAKNRPMGYRSICQALLLKTLVFLGRPPNPLIVTQLQRQPWEIRL